MAVYQGGAYSAQPAYLYVLDGATGAVHFRVPKSINFYATPAVGDIDGDGRPEIVTTFFEVAGQEGSARLVAFDEDGSELWTGSATGVGRQHSTALYDIDADGDVEILYGSRVADHNGVEILNLPVSPGPIGIAFAANLDGDPEGQLEIVLGWHAFRSDGSVYYSHPNRPDAHAQVADIDADGLPEVILTDSDGISVLQHDGTITIDRQKPAGGGAYWRPLAIHDVDGDDLPEVLVGSSSQYVAVRPDMSVVWGSQVNDGSGYAAGTAFDFLGKGTAQAMYADENQLYILGGTGEILLSSTRRSWTETENPVVADVDNDGSAEIVVVSNGGGQPPVQVVRDVEDRWIQARRIWNQHAYHVTNVREDGTIPQHMANNWDVLNTFRTQAQIQGGALCDPEG